MKKIYLFIICAMMAFVAFGQRINDKDSIEQVLDAMGVPLIEKSYIANSNFVDNWYIGLYGGVTSNWGSDVSHSPFFRVMGPAAAITFGKEITPISTVRLQLNYMRNTGVTDNQFTGDLSSFIHNRYRWNSYGLNFDYMLNFTNLIFGFKERRKFYLQGVIGIGGSVSRNYDTDKYTDGIDNSHGSQLNNTDKYDNRQHSLVNIRAGLATTFRVAPNWTLHAELVGNILDNSYDSNPTTENTWDGHNDLLVGISYRFNNKGKQKPGFYYPRHDLTVYKKKLREIGDARDKTNKRLEELSNQVDTLDVNAKVIYTLIAFDEDDATVDRLQQTNIYTTVLAWARDTKNLIYITNSSGVDDRLFRRRVKSIVDILVERYEVPVDKLRVFANEKDIKPTGDYIECIIND